MAALPARCPHCGVLALLDAAFCVECGGRMSSPPKVDTTIPVISVPPPALVPNAARVAPEPGLFDTTVASPSETDAALLITDAEVHPLPAPAPGSSPGSNPGSSPGPSPGSGPSRPPPPPPPPRRASTLPNAHGAMLVGRAPPPPSARNAEASLQAHTTTLVQGSEAPSAPGSSAKPRREPVAGEASPSGMRRMLDDIDQTFDTILTNPAADGAGSSELTPDELGEAQRLFRELSAGYLRPVRNFMLELSLAEPSKEWLTVCRPALASLQRAARDMALGDLAQALGALGETMEQSERTASHVIDARGREALRVAYDRLVALLPEAFTVSDERDRREPIIVLSLLRQVPDVRKVALDRLAAAGLSSLDLFYKAKPADIAEAAGIPRELAERVVARFQRYRREIASQPPAPNRTRERGTLEALARRLEEQNTAFQSAGKSWLRGDDTRRIRQERATTVLEINLLLARLGEVALIERLERIPFQQKSEELRRFLSTQLD